MPVSSLLPKQNSINPERITSNSNAPNYDDADDFPPSNPQPHVPPVAHTCVFREVQGWSM